MNNKVILLLCTLLSAFLITGCASIDKSYPERTMYMFEIPGNPPNVDTSSDATVLFRRFYVSTSNKGKEFIYRVSEIEYKSDFYNQFFRSPGSLITEEISQWVTRSGLFKEVLSPVSQLTPTYVIEGVVNQLYGNFVNPSSPKAILEIQVFMYEYNADVDSPSGVLLGKTYYREQDISSQSPEALMDGWNKALTEILQEFTGDLTNTLNRM